MASDKAWPPVSPLAALLSSPSGRKKYETFLNGKSPMERSATTPSLVDRLRAARTNNDYLPDAESAEDEDEETLQLKLAAIEAKLKLKKLQKDKARTSTPARDLSRPGSSHGLPASQVEAKASPTKRIQTTLPNSPSRVLLGIDKGIHGNDVSLRRANTTATSRPFRTDSSGRSIGRAESRLSAYNAARSAASGTTTINVESRKTFSERMTEARERDIGIEQRRTNTINNRSKGFGIDQTILEDYKNDALSKPQKSPTRAYFEYSRDEVLSATANAVSGSRHLKKSRTLPDLREAASEDSGASSGGDAALFEGFSGLHLSSRVLPNTFLKRTLPSDRFTLYRIPDLLKHIKSPDFELPDGVCDYVVFGIIASKTSPMDHKQPTNGAPNADSHTVGNKDWEKQWDDGSRNKRRFMAITLTDLQWTVDLYLFGTALPRYHRLAPGTIVAILNPGIMPPKAGKSDTGAFSLSLSDGSDTVLEIGQARDLGYCKTIKKDGKECGSWVNRAKTEICEWHLNAEIARTKASRMGVNAGSNGFGRKQYTHLTRNEDQHSARKREGLLSRDGRRYDASTGSHLYIAQSGPRPAAQAVSGPSTSNDPFIQAVEGELVRPGERQARLRKQLEAQNRERDIATKLGRRENSGFGYDSTGAQYLRRKNEIKDGKNKENNNSDGGSQRSAIARTILSSGSSTANGSRKRSAADARLSPVKKTRFVTEKGIREAGRESLPAPGVRIANASDSEDELEIV